MHKKYKRLTIALIASFLLTIFCKAAMINNQHNYSYRNTKLHVAIASGFSIKTVLSINIFMIEWAMTT